MQKLPADQRLQSVLAAAHRWANRFGATYLGTDHAVLGLVEVDGAAKNVLIEAGLTLEKLRDRIVASLPKSEKRLLAPTPEEALGQLGVDLEPLRAELAKEFGVRLSVARGLMWNTALTVAHSLAEQQAERLGSTETTPEHFLLALLWQDDPWVRMGMSGSAVPVSDLRRRLLEQMEIPGAARSRYIRECERSERVVSKRRAHSRSSASWTSESTTEQQITDLLAQGGQAAISGKALLNRVLKVANQSGFSVIDGANPVAPSFWVEVNRRLRQIFVATAIPGSGGEIRKVGVTNPTLVPSWVDVGSWPGLPARRGAKVGGRST